MLKLKAILSPLPVFTASTSGPQSSVPHSTSPPPPQKCTVAGIVVIDVNLKGSILNIP